MLKIKRILSKKGFTLVELMVAVAILAIAAIGIFQAYTTGFQAMADSKDRTVATNIAQKKLEEIKNSVKVAYPYYNIETQELNGKTFTIIVTTKVPPPKPNLEQVIVTVSWKNRNGIEKNVQLETLVYDLKIEYNVPGPDVGQIDLSANTTALTCCVTSETSNITAELFDKSDPKQRVPSGTPVSFQVNNGSVNPEFTVTDASGKAYTTLTINNTNLSIVTATSGLASDQLQVTCTPKANKIDLSANPYAIIPGGKSTITATVTDTCGNIISEEVTVDFVTDQGYFDNEEGKVSTSIKTIEGVATVDLYIETSGVTATVTGTVTPAEGTPFSDFTTVLCTDYSIKVTAVPDSINPGGDNDTSTITAVLTQSVGSPAVGKTISFTTDNDKGSLSATTATTDINGEAVVTLFSLSGGDIATITASYTFGDITISDTTIVQCTEYIIKIKAEPNKIIPDGHSTITVTLTNYLGGPAPDKLVKFYTTKGKLKDASMYTNSSGIATTTLTLSNVNAGEVANVSTTFGYTSDSVPVECIEFILVLTAVPTSITPGGSSEITATLTNYSGIPQSSETINFTTDYGSFTETGGTATTDASGKAIVHLTLNTSGTTAIVTATYGAAKATVSVRCLGTYITLNNPPNITHWTSDYSDDSITFDLYLHGGPLVINKVKIQWQTDNNGYPTRYKRIWIRLLLPSGSQTQLFDRDHNNNGVIETLNRNFPYTIPANRRFQISVNFSYTIRNKHIIFTLNPDDPNAENYQVEFYTPN